jgi:hypothetical protein
VVRIMNYLIHVCHWAAWYPEGQNKQGRNIQTYLPNTVKPPRTLVKISDPSSYILETVSFSHAMVQ